jgi:hypothetical protein
MDLWKKLTRKPEEYIADITEMIRIRYKIDIHFMSMLLLFEAGRNCVLI